MKATANTTLLFTVVLAWGLSWYAIALQVGTIPVEASIAYRFLASGALLLGWCAMSKGTVAVPAGIHPLLALMGVCLFSLNFVLLYSSTVFIASGVCSVVFAGASLMGAVNAWIFDRRRPSYHVVVGALLGISGLALVLVGQGETAAGDTAEPIVVTSSLIGATGIGLVLALAGTYCFSLGNIVANRVRHRTDSVTGTAWAMLYGGVLAGLATLVRHGTLPPPPLTFSYVASLLYLIVGASLVGFLTYLALLQRAGPSRAAYVTVLFPLVALAISTFFEGYTWTLLSFLGLAAILGGALMVFAQSPDSDEATDD